MQPYSAVKGSRIPYDLGGSHPPYKTCFVSKSYRICQQKLYPLSCNDHIASCEAKKSFKELKSFCSPDLEFLTIKCQPHYLPREFSSIIITVAYIPPQADSSTALKELHWTLCKLETTYPEAAFTVAGDFN